MLRTLILAAALVAAGCGGSESSPAWTGPDELRPDDGVLEVAGFRSHADSVDGDWERNPVALAREFLRIDDGVATAGGTTVVVLRDNLEDDSIRAERWVLELERDGDRWQLGSARWGQRCHVGRGHQDFSPELCV